MSISTISKSEIPQLVEEIEKWRHQMNNGEGDSPILSRRGELLSSPKLQTAKGKPYFYITLAKESPQRIYESDASTYDIDFHCMETDICRDSSDTDTNSSFTFDGIATMEVVEYEVRSSSSTEDLYSNNSSSGSDDFLLAAVAAGAMCETSSSYSSGFADTEESESDNIFDSELSAADYWVCVKCKNKQNNPMFRYCEKCYQIRKNHFPPRPRQWKSRSKKALKRSFSKGIQNSPCSGETKTTKNNVNGSLDDVAKRLGKFDSISKNKVKSKLYSCYKNNSKTQLNSAAETSSEDDWSDNYKHKLNTTKKRSRSSSMKVEKISTNASSSQSVSLNTNYLSNRLELELTRNNRKRKLIPDKEEIQPLEKVKVNYLGFSVAADSGSETDIASNLAQLQKDSGISSAAPSSQDVPSSSLSDDHQNPTKINDDHDSSDADTICEELDAKEIAELEKLNTSHDEFNVNNLGRHMSDISSLQSTCSPELQKSPLLKSISAFSEQVGVFPRNRRKSQNCVDSIDNSGNGSCIVCLSEPKNGVFVHSKFVHLCCCYKCAVKIWNKSKRCPVCNCTVKNVMKLFVH